MVGSTLEFYDYLIFGQAAALVFPRLFFPGTSPSAGVLSAFAVFGVGFVARPVGAAIAGHYGDRYGRRAVLFVTLVLMGIATGGIGLLPTYGEVGMWAPALLVACRLVQGLALGGEWAGSVLLAVEQPEFQRSMDTKAAVRRPLLTVLRDRPVNFVLSMGCRMGNDIAFYIVTVFAITYVTHEKLMPTTVVLTATMAAAGVSVITTPLMGALADRVGARRLSVYGLVGLAIGVAAFFPLLNTGRPTLAILVVALTNGIAGKAFWAPYAGIMSTLFSTGCATAGCRSASSSRASSAVESPRSSPRRCSSSPIRGCRSCCTGWSRSQSASAVGSAVRPHDRPARGIRAGVESASVGEEAKQ
ncbi:MFS transporter [Saccharopolyspora hattusasensis]|uniref:MFS transporter n=1 Tax=Saccharopolyspora hattusasensis TaxID=1128679 RepID=UPI003D98A30E